MTGRMQLLTKEGWLLGLCVLLLATRVGYSQLPTATILGVVKDGTGAVIPGVSLTARNVGTGQSRTVSSAEDGSYRFSAMPVGSYEMRVGHPGFQTQVQSGLTLTVGQEAVVNFTLELGAVEQMVEITAEAPLVNTTSGSLGGLVDEQRIAELPLNGRNYIDLTLLQTGVAQHKNVSNVAGRSGVWFSSNGAPMRSNNFLLDGAIMQNVYGATASSIADNTLGVEGIREYRVITNFFSAEYGLTMGSQMVIVSKSGTNDFHGSLFEFHRNSALDARNFFDYRTEASSRRLPAFTRNNFGGSFGGPIVRDKTFFFGVYEGVRERRGLSIIPNVIPPLAKVDGGSVPQIAPVIKPFLALFPDPNLPGNRFTFPFAQPTREDYWQVRVDHTFSGSDTLFGRYTDDEAERTLPLSYPQFKVDNSSRALFFTLSEDHIFSPSLLNTARFSYSRNVLLSLSPSGISGPQFSFVPGQEVGNITIGGITGLGPSGTSPFHQKQNIFTFGDDLFYTRGAHSLKFGALINRYQQYVLVSRFVRGEVGFADLTSFLLGRPLRLQAGTPGSIFDRTVHYTTVGFYVQDDYRVSPAFTLNLGLRYEFATEFKEVRGRGSALRDIQRDAEPTLGPFFKNPTLRNFSPRFGFAWDVKGDGMTALRGGFGLLYDLGNLGSSFLVVANGMPPFASLSTVVSPPGLTLPLVFPSGAVGKSIRLIDYGLQQPHLLQYNLTVERQLPFNMVSTVAYAGSRGLNIIQTKEGNPTVPEILPDGRQFWTGRESRTNPNWDTMELKTAAGNSWYNSLQWGVVKRLSHGLQFQSSYTWSKIIDETQGQLGSDDTADQNTGTDPTNRKVDKGPAGFDIRHNWRFNAIYRLPGVSRSGAPGTLLNGWWVSGILSTNTGYPFTPNLTTNRSRSRVAGAQADRPDLVAGRHNDNITRGVTSGCLGVPAGRKLGGPELYFDPCAFAIQPAGFLGTAGRNILRAPGFASFDFSLAKDTPLKFLGESGKLEFRGEFFNILNRPNFSAPQRSVYAGRQDVESPLSAAGIITQTAGTSRQIQFGLKLLF